MSDETQIPPTPPTFYVLERFKLGRWVLFEALFSVETAAMAAIAMRASTRLRSVDLGAGWSEVEGGDLHATGAEVKPSGARWRWRESPRASWQESSRGRWYARWAALGYEVGPIVSLLG